jgi:hypothetical protein
VGFFIPVNGAILSLLIDAFKPAQQAGWSSGEKRKAFSFTGAW